MKIKTLFLGLSLLMGLAFSVVSCGPKAKVVGTWHLDRVCLNNECKSVPPDASTYLEIHRDGTFKVTNGVGMEGTASWNLKGDRFFTDDGTTKENFHIDTLTSSRFVITETIEIGTQTLALSRQ